MLAKDTVYRGPSRETRSCKRTLLPRLPGKDPARFCELPAVLAREGRASSAESAERVDILFCFSLEGKLPWLGRPELLSTEGVVVGEETCPIESKYSDRAKNNALTASGKDTVVASEEPVSSIYPWKNGRITYIPVAKRGGGIHGSVFHMSTWEHGHRAR
ncbi:hypothetical protein DFH09DRAFT_1091519 [Mycena vulgaris]|nr:hypothetical protein DFH09DRAFT_1091519 [Mycena vulgaris]